MKKNIAVLLLLSVLVFKPVPAHAAVATTFMQFVQNASALINNVTSKISAVTNTVTSVVTTAMKIKQFIDDPMMALFGANSGKQIERETKKWLMSGLNGDPLLIRNPEAYLKNTQTNALRRQIALIEASKNRSPWTEPLITSLIKQRRAEVNPGSAAPKDNSASVVQNSLCANNGEALHSIAEQQAGTELTSSVNSAADDRFDELYATYCADGKDPNTDPDLKRELLALESSGGFFSWDSWLSRTVEGNNDYNLKTRAELEIARRTQEELALAQKEAEKGYLSDKKCIEYSKETDEYGTLLPEEFQKCTAYETKKPSDTVASIANQLDSNTLLKPLFTAAQDKNLAKDALSGLNDMFSGIQDAVKTAQDAINTAQQVGSSVAQLGQSVQDLRGSINTLTGTVQYAGTALSGGGSSKNANTSQINLLGTANTSYRTTYVAYNRSTVTSSSQTSDGSTPDQLAAAIKPLQELLNQHKQAMQNLLPVLSKIDSFTNQYQTYVDSVSSCVQGIKTSQGFNASSDQIYVDDFEARLETKKQNMLNPLVSKISFIKSKISPTNNYLATTLSTVTTMKNISSVTMLFEEYKDKILNSDILPREVDTDVDALYNQSVTTMQQDIDGTSDEATGNASLKHLVGECNTILNQVNSRVP